MEEGRDHAREAFFGNNEEIQKTALIHFDAL